LAKENKNNAKDKDDSIENLQRRLDMLDHRLDDIDSMVSAVIERVMSQPMTIQINCPNCGKNVELALIGSKKPGV
jgi:hypothetical protein